MYVCICNALTERQVRQAAAACEPGAAPEGVYHACGTQPRCRKCVPMVESILRDVASAPIQISK